MKKRIALVCTVWGAGFTDFFCEYSLASLLSQNNLPWLSDHYEVTLALYTQRSDLDRIQLHPNFGAAGRHCDIKITLLESLPEGSHWLPWQHCVATYQDDFFAFILIIPDCVYATDCLRQIAYSLAENELIYYSAPQVCRELIQADLDHRLRSEDAHRCLDLTELDVASLFVKYINPKHAVATSEPDYFITHPEYHLQLANGSLKLTEMACHPMALRGGMRAICYTFNPSSASSKIGFLGILGLSCEYTFKFIEQYFRWPSMNMNLSRCTTLASWSFTFREYGAERYADTAAEITLAGPKALSVERTAVTSRRLKYLNCALHYQKTLFAVYAATERRCSEEIRRCIALAMCLPGFRKLMNGSESWTVFLPTSFTPSTALSDVLDCGDRSALFSFLLMHAVPGILTFNPGHSFRLRRPVPRRFQSSFQAFDPLLIPHLQSDATGNVASEAIYVSDSLVIYPAAIHYRSDDETARP